MPIPLSLLLTASNEAATLGPAIEAFLQAPPPGLLETLVICPDDETAKAAATFAARGVRVLRDDGRGKPAALNLGLAEARGEIVALSDGDVRVDPESWPALLAPFADERVGATTGRPVSLSPRETMLGYWSHLLTDAGAHAVREQQDRAGGFLLCSGYLYAVRRSLIERLPEDALAEDAVISHRIWGKGFRIRYVPEARVFVKYPTTYADWMRQKRRSLAGYAQTYVQAPTPALPRRKNADKGGRIAPRGRTFWTEASFGTWRAIRYARGPQELAWTGLLFLARAHVWIQAQWLARVLRRPLVEVWERVETTK